MQNDISPKKEQVVTGLDSVVIVQYISGLPGGRTLDLSATDARELYAGHPVASHPCGKDGSYAADGAFSRYVPAKLENGKYLLPDNCSWAGVLYRTVTGSDPAAAIMTRGVVNPSAMEVPLDDDCVAALKAAFPTLQFVKDEIA